MSKPIYKARIKATGALVTVYRLNKVDDESKSKPKQGMLCNYNDCSTNYKNSELEILNEVKQ